MVGKFLAWSKPQCIQLLKQYIPKFISLSYPWLNFLHPCRDWSQKIETIMLHVDHFSVWSFSRGLIKRFVYSLGLRVSTFVLSIWWCGLWKEDSRWILCLKDYRTVYLDLNYTNKSWFYVLFSHTAHKIYITYINSSWFCVLINGVSTITKDASVKILWKL